MNIIQEALYVTGWSQRELAERTGISEKKISSKKYHPPDKLVLTVEEYDAIRKIIEQYT
jgi:ribosome-binding protein aMBF1 (putative translation factor)